MVQMLGKRISNSEYRDQLKRTFNNLQVDSPSSFKEYEEAFRLMLLFNPDAIIEGMPSLFSHTGRPSNQSQAMMRSFILMRHFGCHGFEKWISYANSNKYISALAGVERGRMPGGSTHRDFMKRIQCIYFARAVLKNAPVVILGEVESNI
ncbi:MAG: hypothetical protein LBU32_09650, partial [Clostridiales bacterium]|nr:hypothetical protein [Clostridiales bacterium]